MPRTLTDQVRTALAQFSSNTRLYTIDIGVEGLLVEAFAATDAVDDIGARDVIVVAMDSQLDLEPLLGQPAALEVSLANGTRTRFAGDVSQVAMLGSDGGLARYRIRISPWLWRLGQVRNSRVWQDKTVIEIVDSVLESYLPLANWRWSGETGPFMSGAVPRNYCCQYRETDLAFVRRLLTEEGLCWRFEQTHEGPGAVLFADSTQLCAVPEDPSSESGGGIRFHGAGSVEQHDSVQALTAQRRLHSALATVLSYDYKTTRIVSASSPSRVKNGSRAPTLESFDVPGQNAFANGEQAKRYADLRMDANDARSQLWRGRSTVRSLRAGTRVRISGAPLRQLGRDFQFTILRVASIGINNMPVTVQRGLDDLLGPIPELLHEIACGFPRDDFALALAQARETGYANCFEAVATEVVWRPALDSRLPAPTAFGSQSAIVIGPDGSDCANGADELHCDRLGRVRIRFHWQDSGDASCWVRVAQRSAGGAMGTQFLPRIGQEVLVQFLENDIDRPIIVGALYNGQGEGGIVPTPGGRRNQEGPTSRFAPAHDHAPSAQGNVAAGNSPVWHGASGDSAGHRNGAAQWGMRSKEFGGTGYNQLLFDDTDGQGRVQLKSTYAASELNLGHLIHAADNFRGSFRGLGAELRTDAYGAVRAGAGLLISSYKASHGAAARDAAGENRAGIAMLEQAAALAQTFNEAAVTHQTVGLAAYLGAAQANASVLDDKAAPLDAMLATASGATGEHKVPHSTDPIIAIAAKAGVGVSAAQSIQLATGETVTLLSGQDMQFITGGQMRVHTGQAIGMLAGSVEPGEGGTGLQLIAAKDAIDIQAQAAELKIQARDEVNVISANAHIDWAAAKSISLSTAGGANITIAGGHITVQCPGKIKIHAGKKSFSGPERMAFDMPALPRSICVACLKKALDAGPAFTLVE